MTLSEVIEKISEIDAIIKAERELRKKWTAYKRALEAERAMTQPETRKEEDDEH